jgi:hypothetical protein
MPRLGIASDKGQQQARGGERMKRVALGFIAAAALGAPVVFSGCEAGPAASGTFDRTFATSGPQRLEISNPAGDLQIAGSSDGKVHVHAEVRASGFGFGRPKARIDEIVANPPIEQRGDTIRIGKDYSHFRNVAISYQIEVPHDTEIDASMASGSAVVHDVRGPVKARTASGSLRVEHVERYAQLNAISGSIDVADVGDDTKASSASGTVNVSRVKGDVRANAISGAVRVSQPAARVEASSTSGSVEVEGASNDVKANSVSGSVAVRGNPGANAYWDLRTTSGRVELFIPSNAAFHLSAENVSGEIRTDIPIVIEEQTKHSLRARFGNGGARVEIHTISGRIQVSPDR